MSLQNAINFITKVDSEEDFRKSCYSSKTLNDLLVFLANQGFSFTAYEIADAFNVLELQCQTYEQAGRVHELKAWFSLFR